MGRHIVRTFFNMLKIRRVFRCQPIEIGFHIAADGRISIFIQTQRS